jgi:hypothetical protein
MAAMTKIGAALIAGGLFIIPSVYWLGPTLAYIGTAVAVSGFALLLWSRRRDATAAAIGTGGFNSDGTTEPPDVS